MSSMRNMHGVRSMQEVGELMGISRARVLQLEQQALAKLREAIREDEVLQEFFFDVLNYGVQPEETT